VKFSVITVKRLLREFDRSFGPDPVILLGAGASINSGIPMSEEVVRLAARRAYCFNFDLKIEDPTIKEADCLTWVLRLRQFLGHHRLLSALDDSISGSRAAFTPQLGTEAHKGGPAA
jgi:hypothetical protein